MKTLRERVKPRELWLDHWKTALLKSMQRKVTKKKKKRGREREKELQRILRGKRMT